MLELLCMTYVNLVMAKNKALKSLFGLELVPHLKIATSAV